MHCFLIFCDNFFEISYIIQQQYYSRFIFVWYRSRLSPCRLQGIGFFLLLKLSNHYKMCSNWYWIIKSNWGWVFEIFIYSFRRLHPQRKQWTLSCYLITPKLKESLPIHHMERKNYIVNKFKINLNIYLKTNESLFYFFTLLIYKKSN